MSQCQHCTRKTQLPLCTPCTQQLHDPLTELAWLLHELNTTMCRQDHLHAGGTHTGHHDNPINVGAMELLRQTSATLHQIALDVAENRPDTAIPALVNASPPLVALWLRGNLSALQKHPRAGQHHKTIRELTGDTQPGPIHHAINRPDTHLAGPCPTLRAHNRDGEPLHCNTMLYAHDDDTFVRCPRCGVETDVAANRRRAATLRDLLPVDVILEVLDNLGEPVAKHTLYGWISSGRLKAQGFLTARGWAKRRTRPSDPRVYSIARARQLAARQPSRQLEDA